MMQFLKGVTSAHESYTNGDINETCDSTETEDELYIAGVSYVNNK